MLTQKSGLRCESKFLPVAFLVIFESDTLLSNSLFICDIEMTSGSFQQFAVI